jgi:hypothetical protein
LEINSFLHAARNKKVWWGTVMGERSQEDGGIWKFDCLKIVIHTPVVAKPTPTDITFFSNPKNLAYTPTKKKKYPDFGYEIKRNSRILYTTAFKHRYFENLTAFPIRLMTDKSSVKPAIAPGDRTVIGITFGNSNSSIAHTIDDKAEVIANEDGGKTCEETSRDLFK